MEGIGLSTTIFDLGGALYVRGSDLDIGTGMKNRSRFRRVSRTATLDGGVSVYDTGYAVVDRTLIVMVTKASLAVAAFFAYLVSTYNSVTVTTSESAYRGTPMRSYQEDGAAVLEIGINEEIA